MPRRLKHAVPKAPKHAPKHVTLKLVAEDVPLHFVADSPVIEGCQLLFIVNIKKLHCAIGGVRNVELQTSGRSNSSNTDLKNDTPAVHHSSSHGKGEEVKMNPKA